LQYPVEISSIKVRFELEEEQFFSNSGTIEVVEVEGSEKNGIRSPDCTGNELQALQRGYT
jgi:hypothetical protein